MSSGMPFHFAMKDHHILSHMLSWILLASTIAAAPAKQSLERRQYGPAGPSYAPQGVAVASRRPAECKICPYLSCLNAVAVIEGNELGFSCWTQGEEINADKTWIRHVYGAKIDEFCYVNPTDLQQGSSEWYRSRLPYCGAKSELNFFLPKAMTKTELYTECSVCPYRECEGKEFYQANTSLEIDCYLTDGWNQVSPSHPAGTKKYYRTHENCYVSAATVTEIPLQKVLISGSGSTAVMDYKEQLPMCGPVPYMRLEDRPVAYAPPPQAEVVPSI